MSRAATTADIRPNKYRACDRRPEADPSRFSDSQKLYLANAAEKTARGHFRRAAVKVRAAIFQSSIPIDAAPTQLRAHAEACAAEDAAAARALRAVWRIGLHANEHIAAWGFPPKSNRERLLAALTPIITPKPPQEGDTPQAALERFVEGVAFYLESEVLPEHFPVLKELYHSAVDNW